MNVFGDAAAVEFNWDFRAVFRLDDQPLHTTGRESQVCTRTSGGWRLVHVHYSGPPKTGARARVFRSKHKQSLRCMFLHLCTSTTLAGCA